ncbi:MAG: hypothetical protein ABW055_09625 [Pararhizobium sp.]
MTDRDDSHDAILAHLIEEIIADHRRQTAHDLQAMRRIACLPERCESFSRPFDKLGKASR